MSVPPPDRYDSESLAARARARECTDQFRDLPREVQAEYRARWRAEVERQRRREGSQGDRRWHGAAHGALLFTGVTVVWDVPTLVTVPAAVVLSGLTGLSWELLGAGRFRALLLSLPGYVLLRAIGPAQPPFQMFWGFVAFATLATVCGVLREMRTGDVEPSSLLPWRRRS